MDGHVSVLLNECIEYLNVKPNGIYVDATLGGAGHSLKICERLNESGRLIGIDADKCAIERAENRLAAHNEKIILRHNNFSNIREVLDDLKIDAVDGILMDLGVSSYQLDEAHRGFSYMHNAKLDMRMDTEKSLSAYEVVNKYDGKRLTQIIKDYGEERWAARIAQFIVAERKDKPIETTFELVSAIKKAIPKAAREDGPHPAKRTFQAIRIEVNDELGILKGTVTDGFDRLTNGGRMCIITFHSLEDRIIKNIYRELENPCICPSDFPVCVCGKKAVAKVVTRKPVLPNNIEIEDNHRARSAKLRVAEKVGE